MFPRLIASTGQPTPSIPVVHTDLCWARRTRMDAWLGCSLPFQPRPNNAAAQNPQAALRVDTAALTCETGQGRDAEASSATPGPSPARAATTGRSVPVVVLVVSRTRPHAPCLRNAQLGLVLLCLHGLHGAGACIYGRPHPAPRVPATDQQQLKPQSNATPTGLRRRALDLRFSFSHPLSGYAPMLRIYQLPPVFSSFFFWCAAGVLCWEILGRLSGCDFS